MEPKGYTIQDLNFVIKMYPSKTAKEIAKELKWVNADGRLAFWRVQYLVRRLKEKSILGKKLGGFDWQEYIEKDIKDYKEQK